MSLSDPGTSEAFPKDEWFSPTHWSVVIEAGQRGSPQSEDALAKLCSTYWFPIYSFIRRSGQGAEDAQDLTQEFFARLVEKNFIATAEREKGRFRSFLLVVLKRFLANEWDRANRQKRGGGQVILSLDEENCEHRYLAEPADEMNPEKIYERRWVLTVLETAMERLRQESIADGKGKEFDHLKTFLSGETEDGEYAAAAAALKIPKGSVAVAVHRLRRSYRDLVRVEIADTVANPSEVDDEVRHLFAVLG